MDSKKNKTIRELLGIEPFGEDCCTVFVKEFGAEDSGGRTFSLVNSDGSKTDIDKVLEDAFLLETLDMHFSLVYGCDYECLKDKAENPLFVKNRT